MRKASHCCARWACRSGSRRKDGHLSQNCQRPQTGSDPAEISTGQSREEAWHRKTAHPSSQPLLALRTAACVPAEIRRLPPVFPPTRAEWGDRRRDQGELVTSLKEVYDERSHC